MVNTESNLFKEDHRLTLIEYSGRKVTEVEMKLLKMFEDRRAKRKKEIEDKINERNMLIRSVALVSGGITDKTLVDPSSSASSTVNKPNDQMVDRDLTNKPRKYQTPNQKVLENVLAGDLTTAATEERHKSEAQLNLEEIGNTEMKKLSSAYSFKTEESAISIEPRGQFSLIERSTADGESSMPPPDINRVGDDQITPDADKKPVKKIIKKRARDDELEELFTQQTQQEILPIKTSAATSSQITNDLTSLTVEMLSQMSLQTLFDGTWESLHAAAPLQIELSQLHLSRHSEGYALAVLVRIPPDCENWSLNICPPNHLELQNIFLHFNPRYKKNEVVLNEKQGTWQFAEKQALNLQSGGNELNQDLLLLVIVRPEGFYIFNSQFRFLYGYANRRDISALSSLSLVFPEVNDNGKPDQLIVRKVWWGIADSVVQPHQYPPGIIARITKQHQKLLEERRAGSRNPVLRSLVIRNLPTLRDGQEVMDFSDFLYELFKAYGVEATNIVLGKGIGYIRLKTQEQADIARRVHDGTVFGTSDSDKRNLQITSLADFIV